MRRCYRANKRDMIKIEAISKKPATKMSDSSKKGMHGATAVGKTPISQVVGPHFPGLIKVGSKQLLTVKLQEKLLVCLTKLNGSIWFVNHNANLGLKGKLETPKKKHYRNLLLYETMLTKYNNLKYLIKITAYWKHIRSLYLSAFKMIIDWPNYMILSLLNTFWEIEFVDHLI